MSNRTNTKERLVASFKKLAKHQPIDKMTIREITDDAGVLRSTFYRHFQDKYQLLEHIYRSEVLGPASPLIQNEMLTEAVILIFIRMQQDRDFYGKVYRLEGQNSFESIVTVSLKQTMLEFIRTHSENRIARHELMSTEMLADYYSKLWTAFILSWMEDGMKTSPQEMGEIFEYLTGRSLTQILREMEVRVE
ncbi:MAG: TetR/AcrR family transcriptional regulator C-terminal domain-containing protein [Lachnospiraceae bacterium]|nr:TetR/AcrR family transcriptional regulator C-terminal domain-containing protein [Lachnospiraceae bacterium]